MSQSFHHTCLMDANNKQAFAERLKIALQRSAPMVQTGTQLAIQFNLRYHGESVSQQTAHKWLKGLARPNPDKIEILASWLDVSPHWLRFGDADDSKVVCLEPTSELGEIAPTEKNLILHYRLMTDQQQAIIQNLINEFSIRRIVWPKKSLNDDEE
ncbi:transcriptional regulator [Chitinibacter bivalviorum]|uniref:Transcriptional regulator n=1 Tax=Chitinibacter bivalviorum TaxID=2739434 RepID=A0A7H9BIG6_9NEIS|nr:transcriptional regulator [Chitinibacter bivalviorum]QLG88008.1 transcriptional regulator [Chitinibacter bivalviorum]